MSRLLEIAECGIRAAFERKAGPDVQYVRCEIRAIKPEHIVYESLYIVFNVEKHSKTHGVLCGLADPNDLRGLYEAALECGRGARDWAEFQAEKAAKVAKHGNPNQPQA